MTFFPVYFLPRIDRFGESVRIKDQTIPLAQGDLFFRDDFLEYLAFLEAQRDARVVLNHQDADHGMFLSLSFRSPAAGL